MEGDNLEWDWNLHCPVLVSNVILRTLVPEENIDLDKTTLAIVKSKYQGLQDYDAIPFGGISEGVNFPPVVQTRDGKRIHDDDIQVLLVNKQHRVKCGGGDGNQTTFGELEESEEGLAKIRLIDPSKVHPSLTQTEGGKTYLRSDVFLKGIPDIETGESLPYPKVYLQDIQNRNVSTPGWTQSCAFQCQEWPASAKEWSTRQRAYGFPTEQLIAAVSKEKCLLLPQETNHSSKINITWVFSFAYAERRLMNSLTSLQKHIFVLLKILCFQKLSSPRVVEVHHLRALFLYMCEQVPAHMWKAEQLTKLLMYAVDTLLHNLINGSLPHYFIKDVNLLQGLSQDFLDQIQGTVSDIRVGALNILLEFYQDFHFSGTPMLSTHVFEPLRNVIDNTILAKNTIDCVVNIVLPFLVRFTRAHLEQEGEISDEKSVPALKEFHRQIEQILKANNLQSGDITWHLVLREFPDDMFWRICVHEYIVKFVECQNGISFRSNLACYYHASFTQGHQKYKAKAQEMFASCHKMPGTSVANEVDYAVFLCKTENWQLAKDVLLEVVENEPSTNANGYDEQELDTLEMGVQDLGRALGKLDHVRSQSHAFYLLLVTNSHLDIDEASTSTYLQRFAAWCQSHADDYISLALLALAYETSCRYTEALNMYETSSNKAEDNEAYQSWVTRKISTCRNLLRLEGVENGETSGKDAMMDGYVSQNGERESGEVDAAPTETEEVTENQLPVQPAIPTAVENIQGEEYDEELQQAIALSLQLT